MLARRLPGRNWEPVKILLLVLLVSRLSLRMRRWSTALPGRLLCYSTPWWWRKLLRIIAV